MSTIPTPITVYHQIWADTGTKDSHGNELWDWADPIERPVQAIAQFGRRGSSHEIVDADYLLRVESILEMGVPDPTLYSEKDLVIIGASGLDDNGDPIGGTAYHVTGEPDDNRTGPFTLFNRMLGGAVRIRRVA